MSYHSIGATLSRTALTTKATPITKQTTAPAAKAAVKAAPPTLAPADTKTGDPSDGEAEKKFPVIPAAVGALALAYIALK